MVTSKLSIKRVYRNIKTKLVKAYKEQKRKRKVKQEQSFFTKCVNKILRSNYRWIEWEPKSPQASKTNRDGRTTCWLGYWINILNGEVVSYMPSILDKKGNFIEFGRERTKNWTRRNRIPDITPLQQACLNGTSILKKKLKAKDNRALTYLVRRELVEA